MGKAPLPHNKRNCYPPHPDHYLIIIIIILFALLTAGTGVGLTCTRRFSFHEFYNFLPFNFLIFIFFGKPSFYPRHLPTPTTHTHDLRPLPTTHNNYLHSSLLCTAKIHRQVSKQVSSSITNLTCAA